ncbi:MAG: HAD family hydrolase [Ignavibacteriaceae bacterium]|nr:HAD family hydrolase [Ignavibacteriaceae bacterium]
MTKKILKDIRHICFDLDGTLVDSYLNIFKATVKTLEILGIPGQFSEKDFYNRIGHHFLDIFHDLNIPVPDLEHFINIYKSYYFEFIDTSNLYPGVTDVLYYLKTNNIHVSLLTTKGQDQADRIIDHFNLRKYFSRVMGRSIGIPVKPSPEPLLMICRELNILPVESIMAGDTELDIRCGKSANIKTCSVTYGYRSREVLEKENPDFIIDKITDLISS